MHRLVVTSLAAAGLGIGLTAAATAADLGRPVYTKAPVAVPFSWTGFYAGVQAGYGWSNGDVDSAVNSVTVAPVADAALAQQNAVAAMPTDFATKAKGFIGGGTLGYNWQTSQFVWGVETDLSFADIKGTNTQTGLVSSGVAPITIAATAIAEQKLDAFGTLRGRLGFTPVERLLVYGTGGLAYGHVESNINIGEVQLPAPGSFIFSNAVGSASSWRAGWTAGAGFEYAFAPGWSAKAEYLYYDLGTLGYNSTIVGTSGTIGVTSSAEFRGSIARAGINYKFW